MLLALAGGRLAPAAGGAATQHVRPFAGAKQTDAESLTIVPRGG